MKSFVAMSFCLLALVSFSGCKGKEAAKDDKKAKEGHSHGAGPHGGTISDWGGGAYHVEFTVDHDKKEATVYIIGGDAKTPAPIKASKVHLDIDEPKTEFDLLAVPLDGEKDGKSSRFVGSNDTLGIVREFSGEITGEVDGTPYNGKFKEEPHPEPAKK